MIIFKFNICVCIYHSTQQYDSDFILVYIVTSLHMSIMIQMLAPAYQPELSALDHSRVPEIGDQTPILFLSERRLGETLFIGKPLQRLSSACCSLRKATEESQNILRYNFHNCLRPGPGQRPRL